MSALGHYLEEEGIATTIISLIRVHSEKVKAPRSLWVPFELGCPMGPANRPDLQKRVLKAALELLERNDGPSIIEDFDYDGPWVEPDPDWQNPAADMGAEVDVTDMASARAALQAEVEALMPLYDQAIAESGGDPVGVSGLSMDQIVDHIPAFLGDPPETPLSCTREGLSAGMQLRYGADDLKAYYLMAATAGEGNPSPGQLGDWFWQQTAAAKTLIALRAKWKDSDDQRLKVICGAFLVPHVQVHGLGL